ncbi:S1C family serine protease [Streptomyces toxytricini]|uniref:S1C family serine protease n=1 Tax=Streptomyces toxytricini TaxID=67369 RepID=A0ABW8EMQ0_STRT5
MTDSFRRDGEYPQENRPYPSAPLDGAYPPPGGAAEPAPGWYEAHRPEAVRGETAPPAAPAYAPPGYAPPAPPAPPVPPAPYAADALPEPGADGTQGPYGPARTRRGKRPALVLAAVALAAAVVGGATTAGVQQLLAERAGLPGIGFPGTNVSQSTSGTVAGVAEQVSPSVVRIDTRTGSGQGTGSGVIISADGEVVTNNHVISGASEIQVTLSNGRKLAAKTVGTDPDKDLALIRIEGASGLKPARLGNSDGLKVGDEVVAIGSPDRLTGTVTSGIVSALNREVNVPKSEQPPQRQQRGDGGWPFSFDGRQFNGNTGSNTTSYKAIQTDASLNPGNSGGALVNMNGEIVGMPSAIYSPASDSSAAGSVGLGFAIPVNTIKADLPSLRQGGSGGSGGAVSADGFGTSF